MNYITPGVKHNFSKGLPTKLYKVSVPIIATYDSEDIDLFGLPVSYIDDEDNYDPNSYKERTVAMFNLRKILDAYENGYTVRLIDKKDVQEIYDTLTEFLLYTKNIPDPYFRDNIDEEEVNTIRVIDRFLTDIFDIHKIAIVDNEASKHKAYKTIGNIMGNGTLLNSKSNNQHSRNNRNSFSEVSDVHYVQSNAPDIDLSHLKRERQVKYHNIITPQYLKD